MGGPTVAELTVLETMVGDALTAQDLSALSIIGFGEVSMALG